MDIKTHPENYVNDEVTGKIAATFLDIEECCPFKVFSVLDQPGPLKIVGRKEIESSAKKQMDAAMALPITVRGELMPDAHTGYGLPIGGVLATDNAGIFGFSRRRQGYEQEAGEREYDGFHAQANAVRRGGDAYRR